ncbi:helicase SWR1 [Colletotrichum higginsianum]|nr:helicase SWR1 [Colletotrichum higginsianum]
MNKTASPEPAHATPDAIDSRREEQTAPPLQNDTDPPSSPLESLGSDDFRDQLTPNGNDFIGLGLRSPTPPSPTPLSRSSLSSSSPSPPPPASASEDDDERPLKRRRVSTPPAPGSAQKKKHISPPWKKVTADGPTTFIDNGRRKSGRINTIPLEFHPPSHKRMTRGALNSSPPSSKNRPASTNGHATTPISNGTPKTTTRKPSATKPAPAPSKVSNRRATANEAKSTPRSTRKRSPSPHTQPTRQSARTRRGRRGSIDETTATASQGSPNRTRIKLRVRNTELPIVHPGQVGKRQRIGPSFEEYWGKAQTIPVEEGGVFVPEDGPSYTDEMARKEAQVIMRIEQAVEPGGILSQERCSLFVPETEEEPPRQWAHADHMIKAMANFRKLMVAEQQRHRAQAKRVAEACRDAWLRRQPKSAEELEAEVRLGWIGRYRVVVKSMFGTWENVRLEINRRRVQEWEAEEQRRVKAALQQAVNLSEQKLQARRAHADSDLSDDEDLDDEEDLDGLDSDLEPSQAMSVDADDDDSGNDNDDVMSSSGEEEGGEDPAGDAGDAGDEKLTQEQLRAKYANLPDLPPDKQADSKLTNGVESVIDSKVGATSVDNDDDDTSDESIDMDDDMGSTDMDDDTDEGSDVGEESEGEDEDEAPAGLLGMLFGKSELKKIKSEAPTDDGLVDDGDTPIPTTSAPSPGAEASCHFVDEAVEDDDEVSLIQHPSDFINGDEMELDDTTHADEAAPLTEATRDTASQVYEVESDKRTVAPPAPPQVEQGLVNGEDKNTQSPETAEPPAVTPVADAPIVTEDVEMEDTLPGSATVPESAPTSSAAATPAIPTKHVSPDTDIVTVPPSPEQSHSPPTSDTKPSEVDTMSLATPGVKDLVSRSASPHQQQDQKTEIPFLLRGTLREYQHDGLDWLAGLYANNTNGILADEMGLGKTIQTISLLAHLACHHEVWGPHLVIVPTSVMLNWEMEFKKWCPGFKILSYYGTQEERKRKRQGWNNDDVWNVCITSYQLVIQDQQVFKRRRWHYMILDEAHNIKNFKSQRWQTLLGFNTHSRLLLTGTPLQNNLTELWSLLFFLMPAENGVGGFADLQEFHDWFHKPESQILENGRETMDEEARAIISKLHKVLRPYLLRRLKADVEKQMPAKYEHVEFCRLSKRQRELYDGFLARTDTRETLSSGNYLSIINCLMQLRKVCNHPDLFVDRPIMTSFRMQKSVPAEYQITDQFLQRSLLASRMRLSIQFPDKRLLQYDCGKLQALDKLLRKLQAGGHRALIFTQMTKVLDILEQFLNIHGHKYLRLDGATKIEQRQILTDRFNHDPRILCFILSTRSGGLGINLTGADTVIFYDQDWNPAMDKQCQDRCHRIGQTRDVHIYRLVSEHTIEANILRKASQKQMLDDVVIQEGSFTTDYFNKLSVRDVLGTEGNDLVDDAANAAMDRLLGELTAGPREAEDQEDVEAVEAAEKELQEDDAEFQEKSGAPSGASSTRQGTPRDDTTGQPGGPGPGPSGLGRFSDSAAPDDMAAQEIERNAWGTRMYNIDEYMLRTMAEQLKGTALDLPKDKKKSKKKGRDTRKR